MTKIKETYDSSFREVFKEVPTKGLSNLGLEREVADDSWSQKRILVDLKFFLDESG